MVHKYHLYDLMSMAAHIPEIIELQTDDLQEAIQEVIEINRVNREVGEKLLEYGKDFLLKPINTYRFSDGSGNSTDFEAETLGDAAILALAEIFDTAGELVA